jgi:hypothetical protein
VTANCSSPSLGFKAADLIAFAHFHAGITKEYYTQLTELFTLQRGTGVPAEKKVVGNLFAATEFMHKGLLSSSPQRLLWQLLLHTASLPTSTPYSPTLFKSYHLPLL